MIEALPGHHLHLSCDTPECAAFITMQDEPEDALLDYAEARGWHIDREFGLQYCPLTTMYDCEVCGAPTKHSIAEVSTGQVHYYCGEHFAEAAGERS